MRSLPILSLVIAPGDLTGRYGIQGIGGGYYERIDCCFSNWVRVRPGDYFNPAETGVAWERPATLELLEAKTGDQGFRVNSGIRVHGSESSRLHYQPDSKFSYNFFLRGDYGDSQLNYPLMPGSRVKSFDSLVARAGHNDPENPFLTDELMRRLYGDMGQVTSHGTFLNVFINGVFKGYYNLVERINDTWAQQWHGGGKDWDVIQPYSNAQNGDKEAFRELLNFVDASNLATTANYLEVERRLDLVNFADYLILNIYGDTRDWTQNNWRAARERVPGAKFRFYVWDAEISLGIFGSPANHNLIKDPEELANANSNLDLTQIPRLFRKLKTNPEFRLLFADRVQKHFSPGGALSEENIVGRFNEMRSILSGMIPNMLDYIPNVWVPQRKGYMMQHLSSAGLLAGIPAPVINKNGGRVPYGFAVTLTASPGPIYYTLDGTDPRVPFTDAVSPKALTYSGPISLGQSADLKARAFSGGNWSALTEAEFSVSEFGFPVRITEIMYHPIGGEAYEFVEFQNFGGAPIDLSGMLVDGIDFVFPPGSTIDSGSTIVLASASNPAAFAARYRGVPVYGYFNGNLANSSERISLRTADGQTVFGVTYRDDRGWPNSADGLGYSLELKNPQGDPDDPANWTASAAVNGSPGSVTTEFPSPVVRINEVMAENVSAVPGAIPGRFSDWIELYNPTASPIPLAGWSLTDDDNVRKFVFPAEAALAPGGYLLVWCDTDFSQPGIHTGFALDRQGETIALYDSFQNRIDVLAFGMQLPNLSVGLVNGGTWQLCQPTPGAPNSPAALGSIYQLSINEWLANAIVGSDDWIELYNGDNRPVALQGLHVATANGLSQIGSLSFVGPGQQIRLWADGRTGPQHLDVKLSAEGGSITLLSGSGNTIDDIVYGPQAEGISQGRSPDGAEQVVSFSTPTPGYNNVPLANPGIQLNEVLVRNRSGGTGLGWVELYNLTAAPFDLSGMRLTTDRQKPNQWTVPPGTLVPASGFLVISFDNSVAASTANSGGRLNSGNSLSANGGGVYLFNRSGQLVDQVEFGFQVPDRSIGRVGRDWQLLAAVTPGAPNSGPAALGSSQQVRLNEWLAAPAQGDEWIELFNLDPNPVSLTGACLTDDPSLAGRMKFKFGPLSFMEGRGFVYLIADGNPGKGPQHLNFSLDRTGETLQVCSPTGAVIDSIWFGPQTVGSSQGRETDGRGNLRLFTVPTPGDSNSPDSDNDGIPDRWEVIFGLNPADPRDALADPDHDGANNLAEYRAGTHPGDPRMCLKFHETVHVEGGGVLLRFIAAPNRSYSVVYRASPMAGDWTKLADIPAEPEGRWVGVNDQGGPANVVRFYGLVSPQLP